MANVPRGIRNFNPGNIEDGPFARGLPGYAGSDGRFARFASPEAGLMAQSRLLDTYFRKHGLSTVAGIVNRWSPPTENDTTILVNTMARRMGVGPNDRLDLTNPQTKARLIHGFIEQETGQRPYDMQRIVNAVSSGAAPTGAMTAAAPASAAPKQETLASVFTPQENAAAAPTPAAPWMAGSFTPNAANPMALASMFMQEQAQAAADEAAQKTAAAAAEKQRRQALFASYGANFG